MMKKFVIGDIHGQAQMLKDVLDKADFHYKEDKLIVLGDVCDGGYNTYEVVEELLKINNLVFIIGNHDVWFMNHIRSGWSDYIWKSQGGNATLKSYRKHTKDYGLNVPVTHQDFFNRGKYYHIEDNMLFVHGGIDPQKPIEKQDKETLTWDRELLYFAKKNPVPNFDKVFIGHTTTEIFNERKPLKFNNLIMMDCGAGHKGKLAIMNIETEEYWTVRGG